MIQLIVTDLDGCISHPFQPPNWQAITEIKELNEQSEHNPLIPALTICTGRPYPYAEAVAQWLNVRHYVLFEAGTGVYHPKTNALLYSELITPEIQAYFDDLRVWAQNVLIPKYPNTLIEFAKKLDVGVVSPDFHVIMDVYQQMLEKTKDRPDLVEVHNTDVSVNAIYKNINKASGLKWLAELTGIGIHEMAYIGDGMNDAPALELAKLSFAPENARPEAKSAAKTVLSSDSTQAVLEAYKYCITYNRQQAKS